MRAPPKASPAISDDVCPSLRARDELRPRVPAAGRRAEVARPPGDGSERVEVRALRRRRFAGDRGAVTWTRRRRGSWTPRLLAESRCWWPEGVVDPLLGDAAAGSMASAGEISPGLPPFGDCIYGISSGRVR